MALVARHDEVGGAGAAHRKQIVVEGIGADRYLWKILHKDSDLSQLVDEPAGERRR